REFATILEFLSLFSPLPGGASDESYGSLTRSGDRSLRRARARARASRGLAGVPPGPDAGLRVPLGALRAPQPDGPAPRAHGRAVHQVPRPLENPVPRE